MARIQIDLPDRFMFSTEVPIYTLHINKGGHLDNALLLTLVSEARTRFFVSLGYRDDNIEGLGAIVADAAVQYRSEAFYGEIMVVEMAVSDLNKYGGDFVYRLSDKATGREVARGKTGFVFLDYQQKKVVGIPPTFLQKVTA